MSFKQALLGAAFASSPFLACSGEGSSARLAVLAAASAVDNQSPEELALRDADGEILGCDPSLPPVERWGQLRVIGTRIIAQCGEAIQLKGASSMWLNWDDADYATRKDGMEYMRDNWNMSVFRIAMGITPGGGYLSDPEGNMAKVRTIIENAVDLGIYVIVDWHSHSAEAEQAQAEQFFTQIAGDYGNLPNIFYEPYNEPQQVDWNTTVKPYHEAIVAKIREKDPDNIIILGNPSWDQKVDVAANSPVEGSHLMYALHFYSCDHSAALRTVAEKALLVRAPLFVTEWGGSKADGGTSGDPNDLCLDSAKQWHDWMDTKKISWTAWKMDGGPDLTCFFPDRGTDWFDGVLWGHTPFVVERMQK